MEGIELGRDMLLKGSWWARCGKLSPLSASAKSRKTVVVRRRALLCRQMHVTKRIANTNTPTVAPAIIAPRWPELEINAEDELLATEDILAADDVIRADAVEPVKEATGADEVESEEVIEEDRAVAVARAVEDIETAAVVLPNGVSSIAA